MGGFVTINKLEALARDKVAAMTHNHISSPAEVAQKGGSGDIFFFFFLFLL